VVVNVGHCVVFPIPQCPCHIHGMGTRSFAVLHASRYLGGKLANGANRGDHRYTHRIDSAHGCCPLPRSLLPGWLHVKCCCSDVVVSERGRSNGGVAICTLGVLLW
jgi:hypothetical protein